jgi:hypothetical protein
MMYSQVQPVSPVVQFAPAFWQGTVAALQHGVVVEHCCP